MQHALPFRPEKPLASASAQGNLGMAEAARQMGRLSGPSGGAARQELPAAKGEGTNSSGDDFSAWAAYRMAKKGTAKDEGAGEKVR